MSSPRDFIFVYRERLIAYAIGGFVIVALLPFSSHAAVKPVISAILRWACATTVIQVWMSLIKVWDDPSLTFLGISNRRLDFIILVAGIVMTAVACVRGSQTMGTWGCLVLLFSLEGRLCEHESGRRFKLKQRVQ